MKLDSEFIIGAVVKCNDSGSWVDGKEGRILHLNTVSSDGVFGHLLQMDEGVTVIPEACLTVVRYEPLVGKLKEGGE